MKLFIWAWIELCLPARCISQRLSLLVRAIIKSLFLLELINVNWRFRINSDSGPRTLVGGAPTSRCMFFRFGNRRESETLPALLRLSMFTNFIRFLIKNLYSSETPSDERSPSNAASLLGFALAFGSRNDTHAPIFFALLQRSRCFHSHLYNLVAFYALSGLTIVNTIYVIYEPASEIRTDRNAPTGVGASAIDLETKQKPQKDSSSLLLFSKV